MAIVGCGPVGLLLAILLARAGHDSIIVEKWPTFYERPRAVTYDHEIARILGILGIDSENDPAIEFHDDLYYWKNADRETLLEVDWNSMTDSAWRTRYWFYQPDLEKRLREIAGRYANIEIRTGWEADGVDQDGRSITVSGTHGGRRESINARFAVGADGANSFVREALGIEFADLGYFFDWLILDLRPTDDREFTPAHWQLCDPARPTTIVPGGPGRRRWEFMALPGEDPQQLATPESAWQLLEPWDVTPDNAILERSAVYRFQARWATQWRQGRGLIAGDAAHLMPPFAGEGMCAGLRDALALAWRLDLVLSGRSSEELLDSYTTERVEHVTHYIRFSMDLGRIICIADREEAASRDARMIAELAGSEGTPVNTDVATLGAGLWCADTPGSGELSVQGVVDVDGRSGRFDDLVGRGWVILGWDTDPAEVLDGRMLGQLSLIDAHLVPLGPAGSGYRVTDADGCYGRWFSRTGARFAVLRPDFYVAATAATTDELTERLEEIIHGLHLSTGLDREGTRPAQTL